MKTRRVQEVAGSHFLPKVPVTVVADLGTFPVKGTKKETVELAVKEKVTEFTLNLGVFFQSPESDRWFRVVKEKI